jgi:hypothetical protein
MRWFSAILLVTVFAFSAAAYESHMLVEVVVPDNMAMYELMRDFDLDIASVHRDGDVRLEIVTDRWQLSDLRRAGYYARVLIPDMESYYAAQYAGETMGGFRTYDEINIKLDSIHADYPTISTSKFSIGLTYESRETYAIEISDNPGVDEGEAGFLGDALIHAREPTSSMCLLNAIDTLLHYYSLGDPAAVYLIENRQTFVLPCSNPDGYVHNQMTDPGGGGMWRKNMRPPDGTDLNRNWGLWWGYNNIGSSPDPGSEVYRGDSAWSEPETRNMRDFLLAHPDIKAHWHIHTYGDKWLWPYGPQGFQPGPDTFAVYQDWDSLLCQPWAPWPAGPSWQVLYETNGGTKDWVTGVHGAICITPELGTSFWPSPSELPTQYANTTWPIINWIRASGAFPIMQSYAIDDSGGNNNGMIDPGESVDITPTARNVGRYPDWNVIATLKLAGDPYVTITDSVALFGDLSERSAPTPSFDTWALDVDGSCPVGYPLDVVVWFESDSGYFGYDTLNITVGAPPDPTALPTGPDAYGYYAYDLHDSLYTEAPVYDWFDISGIGTPGPTGDDSRMQVTLPFTFTYYGTNYTTGWICTNGWFSLGSDPGTSDYSNSGIPNSDGPPAMIAPLWDDLNPNDGGNIRFYDDAANNRFIVQWTGISHWGTSGGTPETFQVVLYDPAYYPTLTGDGEIILFYNDNWDQNDNTVGIENSSQTIGIQYYYDGTYEEHAAGLGASTCAKFTTDPPVIVGVEDDEFATVPLAFALHAAYPNPFNPATTIAFDLPRSSTVRLDVYNVLGQRVATLVDGELPAGAHEILWEASSVGSGVYFARIVTGENTATTKMVLLK